MPADLAFDDSRVKVGLVLERAFEGSESLMKKLLTVAVAALAVTACSGNTAENNVANETAVENAASTDVNAATGNDVTLNADAALNAADNAVENAGNAIDNAAAAVENKTN
jgi:hypothetical protein